MTHPWLSRSRAAVPFTVALALGVRAATLAAMHGTPFTRIMVGDSLDYLRTAGQIAAGRMEEIGVFFQSAPHYPFLLAAFQRAGADGWLPVVLLQSVVGALACGALAQAAGVAFPDLPAAPWATGILAALCGPLVFHDAEILPASLAASLLAFALLLLLGEGGWRRALAAGILLGAATGLAPSLLLVVGWAAAWLAIDGRRRRRRRFFLAPAALAAGAGVLILPITAHNLAAGDRVLISSNAGVNAFIGNNAEATGAFYLPAASGLDGTRLEDSSRGAAEAAEGRPLRPSEVSRHWAGRARAWAAARPGDFLRLLGRKVLLSINHYEIPNHLNFYFLRDRFAPPLRATIPFWMLLPLAAVGTGRALLRREAPGLQLAALASLCLMVPVLFFVTGRYRLPAAPALLLLAGAGAAWLIRAARDRSWRRLAAGLAVLVAVALPARLRMVREGDYAFDHLLLGDAQRRLGELDGAVLELKLAEETGPARTDAGYRLAQVLLERGNPVEAAAALRRHVSRHPGDAEAQTMLPRLAGAAPGGAGPPPRTDYERGTDLARAGDLEGARQALERAVERDPTHWLAWLNLGVVYDGQRRSGEAIARLERAADLAPSVPDVWINLAAARLKAGRPAEAREAAGRAAELAPDDPRVRQILQRTGR